MFFEHLGGGRVTAKYDIVYYLDIEELLSNQEISCLALQDSLADLLQAGTARLEGGWLGGVLLEGCLLPLLEVLDDDYLLCQIERSLDSGLHQRSVFNLHYNENYCVLWELLVTKKAPSLSESALPPALQPLPAPETSPRAADTDSKA